jgi:large subunit ribosomal protein L23
MNLSHLIKQPVITEKSLIATGRHIFTFIVDANATKPQIASAVNMAYKVDVVGVATRMVKGKTYTSGRRRQVKYTTPVKKAYVELKPGQKIDLFDIKEEAAK